MNLDMERICQLAGVKNSSKVKAGYGVLSENRNATNKNFLLEGQHAGHDTDEDVMYEKEGHDDADEGIYEEEADAGMYHEGEGHDEGMEETIEVDEAMLVQELRRARRIMSENRKIKAAKQEKLQEMQLKGIIDQEVKNILKELQLNSGWVYGKNKPTKSKKGYTHQGSFLKGIGFK